MKTLFFLIDEEKIEALFKKCAKIKTSTEQALAEMKISQAYWLARLYNTPDSGIGKLKEEVNEAYEKRSILSKFWDLIDSPIWDMRKDLKKEIEYRKNNSRNPDDWKEAFMEIPSCFKKIGWEKELNDYVTNELIPAYQKKLEDKN